MSHIKRFLEDFTVQVWLNANAPDSFIYGWQPEHTMQFACSFVPDLDPPGVWLPAAPWLPEDRNVARLLELVFSQLNVDDPTAQWAKDYRADRRRSLSVGDVVVVGEVAYACESVGWKQVSLDRQRCQR